MYKTIFDGELRSIQPNKIIKQEDNDNVDKFFLILGLIFNDLKNLLFQLTIFEKEFKDTNLKDIGCDFGEYHGIKNHINRLITSTIYEFLVFLEKQSRIINSDRFKVKFNKLNSAQKKSWTRLINIANKKNLSEKGTNLIEIMENIRNNGSFHYYSSGDNVRKGFIDHFYNRRHQHKGNEMAYYSIGKNMHNTRYFYCDAAIEGAHIINIKGKFDNNEFHQILIDLINEINFSIESLMKIHIKNI